MCRIHTGLHVLRKRVQFSNIKNEASVCAQRTHNAVTMASHLTTDLGPALGFCLFLWRPLLVTVTSALVANENHTVTVYSVYSWPVLHPIFSDTNRASPHESSWHPSHLLLVCCATPPIFGTLNCTSLQLGEILNRCSVTVESQLKMTRLSHPGISVGFLTVQYVA